MKAELVKMSGKGQLVIPQDIREKEDFKPGDRFISFPIEDGIIFKRIDLPDPEEEFQKLSDSMAATFKKKGISRKDLEEAVAWSRKNSS